MGSFTPLVFSGFEGMGVAATAAFKRLAFLLATKAIRVNSIVLCPG